MLHVKKITAYVDNAVNYIMSRFDVPSIPRSAKLIPITELYSSFRFYEKEGKDKRLAEERIKV